MKVSKYDLMVIWSIFTCLLLTCRYVTRATSGGAGPTRLMNSPRGWKRTCSPAAAETAAAVGEQRQQGSNSGTIMHISRYRTEERDMD
jgi:hypothetical protein